MQLLIRILGIIALILCVIPFQFKKHKHIVLCKMASELMFAAQYFLMGPHAYTGACLDLISGGRNFLFYKLVEKKKSTLPVIIFFSVFMVVLGAVTWSGWLSLLPVCAKVISTVSYGMRNEKLLRFITLPSMGPQLMFAAVMQIGASFGVSGICVALAGNPSTDYAAATIVTHLSDVGTARYEMGYASAIAVVLFAIMLLAWVVINKSLRKLS